MTNTDLNKKMTKWIGWKVLEPQCGEETCPNGICCDTGQGWNYHEFNPAESISDAWMLVEKIMKEQSFNKKKQFTDELKFIFHDKQPAKAICKAVEKVMDNGKNN